MKSETNYYIVPLGSLPDQGGEDQQSDEGAMTVLTRNGRNYLVLPAKPSVHRGLKRTL